jgi:hypothetical protein
MNAGCGLSSPKRIREILIPERTTPGDEAVEIAFVN